LADVVAVAWQVLRGTDDRIKIARRDYADAICPTYLTQPIQGHEQQCSSNSLSSSFSVELGI